MKIKASVRPPVCLNCGEIRSQECFKTVNKFKAMVRPSVTSFNVFKLENYKDVVIKFSNI